MIVKRAPALNGYVLGGIGVALLLAGFFLIVPEHYRNSIAWLDLAVVALVFLFNMARLPMVRFSTEGFSRQVPKLGMLWTIQASYTSLALGGAWYMWLSNLAFRYQLFYQVVVLFGMLVAVSSAGRASAHVGAVEQAEKRKASSLQTLRSAMADCEAAFIRSGAAQPEYGDFQRLKEDIRYLSPCSAPNAVTLDLEMSTLLENMSGTLAASKDFPVRRQDVQQAIGRCRELIRLRQQERDS